MFCKCDVSSSVLAVIFALTTALASGQTAEFPKLEPLPPLDTLTDDAVVLFAQRLLAQTIDIRDVLRQKAQQATAERERLSEQLAAALTDSSAKSEEIGLLGKAFLNAQNAEKTALQDLQRAERTLASLEKTVKQSVRALRKNLPKAYKRTRDLIPNLPERPIAEVLENVGMRVDSPLAPSFDTALNAAKVVPQVSPSAPPPSALRNRLTFKKYDPTMDVMLFPPARGCTLTTDMRDEFSGELRREVQREELFRYTMPSLRPYLQGQEHIICHASVSQNGKIYLLNLVFTIHDANAKRTFGSLPKNSVAIWKFLDGETLTLANLRSDEGRVGDDRITHVFVGQYVLDPPAIKKMQKSLLDKVRIAWATGYEDYEIHQVDLIARQIGCLLKR
ncbi:MAG: hypothetical protein NZM43_11560 [Saprospiraceae bacterium]|nr:hypothetical protein [Saprospiraceae bacterium]MDW8484945.1 hypothetical protein [Saprospiraceae bacterium]